jgi:Ca2+-binding EF-hand superfamily protein
MINRLAETLHRRRVSCSLGRREHRFSSAIEDLEMPLTPEERGELEESFQYNDLGNAGSIEFDECLTMLTDMDSQVSPEQARIGFQAIDSNNDGVIGMEEFIEWLNSR